MPKKLGLVHVYTGHGKGKTSLAVGMALRAVGQNLKVQMVQFLKGGYYTGEYLASITFIPGLEIHQFGKPCIKEKKQLRLTANGKAKELFVREDEPCRACRECFLSDDEERLLSREAFLFSKNVINDANYDLVVLDEVSHAVNKGWVSIKEILALIQSARENGVELILTGRDMPQEILEEADLVTEMNEIKHPFQKGVSARRGIEY
jgi:cob(I)alamin adenosyltransferase